MSTPIFDPEDPRLTAYALGETLLPTDQAEVKTLLQYSPEARAAMKEIQDLTLVLTAEYDDERRIATEPTSPLTPNIIRLASHLPAERRTWVRPLLAAAAILLAVAGLASLVPPLNGYRRHASVVAQSGIVNPRENPVVTEIKPAPAPAAPEPRPDASMAKINEPFATPTDSLEGARAKLAADSAKLAALNKKMTDLPARRPSVRNDSLVERRQGGSASASSSAVQADAQNVEAAPVPAAPALASRQAESAPPALAYRQNQARDLTPLGETKGTGLAAVQASVAQLAQAEATSKARQTPFVVTAVPARRDAVPQNGVVSGLPTLALQDGRTLDKPEPFGIGKDKTAAGDLPATRTRLVPLAPGFNTAAYDHLTENPFLTAKENPLSTFSADVDTAAYANVRRFIEGGSLPPPDAVRVEELINYFPYDYAPPAPDSGKAFAVHLEAAACPWAPEHRLVRIGIKGREVEQGKRPASNLVFLIDVSGSMRPPERLPLIKRAMSMMVEHLDEQDHVAIVTYAGHSGLALPSTSGEHKDLILAALDRLEAGGSTNGASGITLAYRVAKESFIKGGTNRVILATDGDFNVGVTSQGDLIRLIQEEAKSGVFLSALGVGTDNYKDATMQKLADKGNGNYHYIDRLEEARKVLVDQMGGTLVTIAKDVKIQVEFNPAVVAAYRLIGYEKRLLRKEDFNDDRIDAGEIGAGHTVTALYEVVPAGQALPGTSPAVDALKYGAPTEDAAAAKPESTKAAADAARPPGAVPEMLTVKMRHKAPDAEASERSYEEALTDHATPDDFARASADFKFAAAVADFGLVLRDSPYKGSATLGAAAEWAQEGKGADPKGYRAEFIELVRRAQALKEGQPEVDGPVR